MRRNSMLLALCFGLLISLAAIDAPSFAQGEYSAAAANFHIGEKVLASPSYNSWDWRNGVIVDNNPDAPFMRVNVEAGNGFGGGVYMVSRTAIKKAGSGAVAVAPQAAAPGATTAVPQAPQQTTQANANATNAQGGENSAATGNFQVGETVLASPSYNSWDWRKGVIVDNNPDAPFQRVNVEAGNGFAGGVYIVSRTAIKKAGSVVPAGKGAEHNGAQNHAGQNQNALAMQQPAAAPAVTPHVPETPQQNKATPQGNQQSCCPAQPSLAGNSTENIIKRSIYDRYIVNGHSFDVGQYPSTIVFHSFSISGPRDYKMPEAWAYNTGSPDGPGGMPGTKVYEVKTKYTVCVDEQPPKEFAYRGYTNYRDIDAVYFALQHYKTGAWQTNQSSMTYEMRSVKK